MKTHPAGRIYPALLVLKPMKPHSCPKSFAGVRRAALLGALAAALTAPLAPTLRSAPADEPGPDRIRTRIQELEKKGVELRSAGQREELEKVMAELADLRAQAVRAQTMRDRPAANPERRAVIEKRLDGLRAQAAELESAGKKDQAAEIQRQVEKLEVALRTDRPTPDRVRDGGPRPEADVRQREHVEIAMEHLRAAGYPEIAERIGQEIRRRQGPLPNRGFERTPGADAERMQAELNDLRQAVRDLKRRLEEVAQDRR